MRPPSASTDDSSPPSSSSMPSTSKLRKRKWTREQLLRNLEILGPLSAPLPPDLPPSPPASRAPSPVPILKRKSDAVFDYDHIKRPRQNHLPELNSHHRLAPPASQQSQQVQQHQQHHFHTPHPSLTFSSRLEPAEDGEVREDPTTSRPSAATPILNSLVPVRRPRRGRPVNSLFDEIHDRYHRYGRIFKYSGDARFWSTFPATHKEYRPLLNPPPPNSSYHKFGGLIARLELMDALVCFAYSIWSKDYSRRACMKETWATIEAFLAWCKHKWQAEDTVGDREKAFIGVIWMIEAFIHGRKTTYAAKYGVDAEMEKMTTQMKKLVAEAIITAEADVTTGLNTGGPPGSHPAPSMLPSPESIAPINSANSTPTGRPSGSTPNPVPNGNSGNSAASGPSRSQSVHSGSNPCIWPSSIPMNMFPQHYNAASPPSPAALAAASSVSMNVGAAFVAALKEQVGGVTAAASCMDHAQRTLSLPVMARHFPTTFARMMHSSLLPHEEYEPDIEDEEGELFWPGQLVTGEGLGWVCLMGKAMIKELGKEVGYMGLDGVVPKPRPDEHGADTPPVIGGSALSNGGPPAVASSTSLGSSSVNVKR